MTTVKRGDYSITVVEATVLHGMRRTMGRMDAQPLDTDDTAIRILKMMTYPDLIAAVNEHEGFKTWPPTFEEFVALPERFVAEWEKVTYELNPHWLPGVEDEEKKIVSE